MQWNRLARVLGIALLATIALSPVTHADEEESSGQGTTLGLEVARLDQELLDRLANRSGLLVTNVTPGGLADRAGIVRGDVLVVVGSVTLRSIEDLARAESRIAPGQPVSVVFSRNQGRLVKMINVEPTRASAPATEEDGEREIAVDPEPAEEPGSDPEPAQDSAREATGTVLPEAQAPDEGTTPRADSTEEAGGAVEETAEETPPPPAPPSASSPAGAGDLATLGLRGQDLTPDLAAALGIPRGRGVLVLEVSERGPAALAGVRAGDVITRAGEQPIWGAEHLKNAMRDTDGPLTLSLRRQGRERQAEVQLVASAPEPDPEPAAGVAEASGDDERYRGLREEVRRLRSEVRRLREEVAELKRGEPL